MFALAPPSRVAVRRFTSSASVDLSPRGVDALAKNARHRVVSSRQYEQHRQDVPCSMCRVRPSLSDLFFNTLFFTRAVLTLTQSTTFIVSCTRRLETWDSTVVHDFRNRT